MHVRCRGMSEWMGGWSGRDECARACLTRSAALHSTEFCTVQTPLSFAPVVFRVAAGPHPRASPPVVVGVVGCAQAWLCTLLCRWAAPYTASLAVHCKPRIGACTCLRVAKRLASLRHAAWRWLDSMPSRTTTAVKARPALARHLCGSNTPMALSTKWSARYAQAAAAACNAASCGLAHTVAPALSAPCQVALISPILRELVLFDGAGTTHEAPLQLPKQVGAAACELVLVGST